MSDVYCLLAVAISLVALIYMAYIVRGVPRPRIFASWKGIIGAWRQTADIFEKVLFLFVLWRQLSRGLAISLVIATITAAATIGTSLCGMNPEALKVVREIINDVLRWLRGGSVPGSQSAIWHQA